MRKKLLSTMVGLMLALGLAGAGQAQTPVAASAGDTTTPAPLSFKIGAFTFTPGGFLDFTTVYRSTAVGSGIGTNFASIPYNNTTAGELSELRESAQNSRLSLRADGTYGATAITAYVEADFLGNQPTNIAVTSNSATMRMRVYFLDLRNGSWEMVAGQDWSLLTPNRVGLSPIPADIFYTMNMDTNYQVGLAWARQPQFRLMYHASPNLVAGLSLEQGEQYIGGSSGAPTVTLPGTTYATQVDSGATSYADPGFTPDVIGKVAYDSAPGGHGIHLELAGSESEFRDVTPAGLQLRTAGGSVSANANAEITSGLHLVANSFFGDGGGRYFFGMAPDMIIRSNGEISPVLTQGGMAGFEYQMNPGYMLYSYYGGIYIRPDFDLSGATPVGYGFAGSPNSINRAIQEASLGIIHTFWKSPQYGALQLITQGSYLVRDPFSVPAGSPKNAHTGMAFVDIRYVLP